MLTNKLTRLRICYVGQAGFFKFLIAVRLPAVMQCRLGGVGVRRFRTTPSFQQCMFEQILHQILLNR